MEKFIEGYTLRNIKQVQANLALMRDYIKEEDQSQDRRRLKLKPKSELHHPSNCDIWYQEIVSILLDALKNSTVPSVKSLSYLTFYISFVHGEQCAPSAMKKSDDKSCREIKRLARVNVARG